MKGSLYVRIALILSLFVGAYLFLSPLNLNKNEPVVVDGPSSVQAPLQKAKESNEVPKISVQLNPDPCASENIESTSAKPVPGTRVLVTGGAGFIGSHLVGRLVELGYKVLIMDNLATGHISYVHEMNTENTKFMFGDILNLKDCEKAMVGIEYVYHLAAMSKVVPSLKDPEMAKFCVESNEVGSWNILKAAQESGTVKKVIYAASSTYYGNQETPHNENMAPDFLNPYAASKYGGEVQMQLFSRLFKVPTVSCRFFMVYGPRQPTTGAYAIVTGVFMRQLKEKKPLTIEGDGSHSRDFIHALDIAEGLILSQQNPDLNNTVVNLGTGKSYSVKDVANMISPNQVNIAERPNDLVATLADTCRMKKLLKFNPSKSFPDEIKAMVKKGTSDTEFPEWFKEKMISAPWLLPAGAKHFEYQGIENDVDAYAAFSKGFLTLMYSPKDWSLAKNPIITLPETTPKNKYLIVCENREKYEECQKMNLACVDAGIFPQYFTDFELHVLSIAEMFLKRNVTVNIASPYLVYIKDSWDHYNGINMAWYYDELNKIAHMHLKPSNATFTFLNSILNFHESFDMQKGMEILRDILYKPCGSIEECLSISKDRMPVLTKKIDCQRNIKSGKFCENKELMFAHPEACGRDKAVNFLEEEDLWGVTHCHPLSDCEIIPISWFNKERVICKGS